MAVPPPADVLVQPAVAESCVGVIEREVAGFLRCGEHQRDNRGPRGIQVRVLPQHLEDVRIWLEREHTSLRADGKRQRNRRVARVSTDVDRHVAWFEELAQAFSLTASWRMTFLVSPGCNHCAYWIWPSSGKSKVTISSGYVLGRPRTRSKPSSSPGLHARRLRL